MLECWKWNLKKTKSWLWSICDKSNNPYSHNDVEYQMVINYLLDIHNNKQAPQNYGLIGINLQNRTTILNVEHDTLM